MKNTLIIFFVLFTALNASGQLVATRQCPDMDINLLKGFVNGMGADFTPGQIKKALPCFTADEPESDSAKCGGLISYSDQDVYFYTARDYVEIREKFKGKMNFPMMGAVRSSLFNWLGYPKIKDVTWEAFQTAYGILVIHFDKANKVNLIQFSTKNAENLKLCN